MGREAAIPGQHYLDITTHYEGQAYTRARYATLCCLAEHVCCVALRSASSGTKGDIDGVGLIACSGDGVRDTVGDPVLRQCHDTCVEARMALVTLQTIFQEAFPAYEQTHPLPAYVRRAARAIMQCRTAA